MNKVLIAIPSAPVLLYGEHEKAFQVSDWALANHRWDRVWGRFSGASTERQKAVRETWAPEVVKQGATFKFFMGRDAQGQEWPDDVVLLDCADGYLDLPDKIKKMAQWAVDRDFDILFKCDDDTFVYPGLVPFLQHTDIEYGGSIYNSYAVGGGPGYIWNRRAMAAAIAAPLTDHPQCKSWEDWWFAEVMRAAGIKPTNVPGICEEPNAQPKPPLTFHPVSPKGMRQAFNDIWT